MSDCSRKWFYALAACVAAGLNVGAGTAAAANLTGIGLKAPVGQNDVLTVGYPSYYGSEYDAGFAYDDYPGPSDYYPPRARYYAGAPWESADYERRDYERRDYIWLPPPRPSSCGEYHYWNGSCCVDARRHPPYVGPRW